VGGRLSRTGYAGAHNNLNHRKEERTMALIERAKNILLQPRQEWGVIAGETTSTAELYTQYIMPLAAIGPLATILGLSVFGMSMPFVGTYRVPFMSSISYALTSYLLSLVAVFVLALIINALAQAFGGERNQGQALKLAAYASTPGWLGGVFGILPWLGILALLAAIYGLYLLYLGLPVLMKSPSEKAAGYTVVVVISAIVVSLVMYALAGALVRFPGHPMMT
jgi:hypothetical protein